MATFYVGPRPVLKGQNTKGMVNPYTSLSGKAKGSGTYSYYSLYSTSHILDGAPDRNHTPGTGYFPGDVFLSQLFNGTGDTLYIHPLSGTFQDGAHYSGSRFRPMEYKGLTGAKAFPSTFGHIERENDYKTRQYRFKGVASALVFANTGHSYGRTDAQGAPASFGFFLPDDYQGVASAKIFPESYGQTIPTDYNHNYGKNKIQEWRGVASAKAL